MERDYKRFPHDENGDVLWRMFCNGDRLDKARMIEFALIFSVREDALRETVQLAVGSWGLNAIGL